VKDLRLEHHVTFSSHLPGRRDLYRIFDIVVVPTLRGGVGATSLEAMAVAKPVIASAVGEVLEIIQDRKTGLLVPESDPAALARAIAELLRDPEFARGLGREARRHVSENFSLVPMAKATREFYEEVKVTLSERQLAR
jgi:glycosyltransferase involved in cell wall biosynthesis